MSYDPEVIPIGREDIANFLMMPNETFGICFAHSLIEKPSTHRLESGIRVLLTLLLEPGNNIGHICCLLTHVE